MTGVAEEFQLRMGLTRKVKQKRVKISSFPAINPNAAGVDIGSSEHWVAVPEDRDEQSVRPFGCFTEDLNAMADWLKECGPFDGLRTGLRQ